jgi:hypothetical protein
MMGAGGAMMLWRLAWLRGFPDCRGMNPPYTPSIPPMSQDWVTRENRGSWEYYKLLRNIRAMSIVWPPDRRPVRMWLDGPRHDLNTDIAA